MASETRSNEAARLTEEILRARLGDPEVAAVRVVEDVDADADPVYRVTVVLKMNELLEAHKAVSLVRHLRRGLRQADAVGFPLISYVSKGDAARLATEAA